MRAPLPVVPTAPGGFEDLRKVKERMALTLQNNPAWVGWGEGTPQRSKCVGGLIPQKPVPRGKQRISSNMAWGKKSTLFEPAPTGSRPRMCTAASITFLKLCLGLGALARARSWKGCGRRAGRQETFNPAPWPRLAHWAAGKECPFSRC